MQEHGEDAALAATETRRHGRGLQQRLTIQGRLMVGPLTTRLGRKTVAGGGAATICTDGSRERFSSPTRRRGTPCRERGSTVSYTTSRRDGAVGNLFRDHR